MAEGIPLNVSLSYYKRPEIRQAMASQCVDKEVGVKYGLDKFGKRPDVIIYDSDVLSFAQKKVTSFHISEESWGNPMILQPGMRRADLDAARVGWDLVIDIDFTNWEASKVITDEIVQALLRENVPEEAITCKFSGNKGFHIAIPFEAFPDTYVDSDHNELITCDLFPEAAKLMVEYILDKIDSSKNGYALSSRIAKEFDLDEGTYVSVYEDTGEKASVILSKGNEFICANCKNSDRSEQDYLICSKCDNWMERIDHAPKDDRKVVTKVDLGVDHMLLSSRHMYRLVYSLHEKSSLASVPVDIKEILSFDKNSAKPENVKTDVPFLDRNIDPGCAFDFFQRAMNFKPKVQEERKDFSQVEWVGDAAPEELFPPGIKKMLAGMEDGRKRALFVLTNFLRSVGWSYEMIEARLQDWNEANSEPLREQELKGHIRYHKQKGQKILPPNFDNDMYYKDLGVLIHDELSERLKNPVQYVRLKAKRRKVDKEPAKS